MMPKDAPKNPTPRYRTDAPNENIIIRIRAKRRMLIRLHEVVDYDRSLLGERDWNVSDVCREAIHEYLMRRVHEIQEAGIELLDTETPTATIEEREGPFVLKIQTDERMIARIRRVIEYDIRLFGGNARGAQSRLCVEALDLYLRKREIEIHTARSARFTGDGESGEDEEPRAVAAN